MNLETKFKKARDEKDLKIYNDYCDLMKNEGAMSTEVTKLLMKKYGIFSPATIWSIRKRIENKLS